MTCLTGDSLAGNPTKGLVHSSRKIRRAARPPVRRAHSPDDSLKVLEGYGLLPVTTSASPAMEHDPKDADMLQFPDRLPEAVFQPVGKASWGPVSDRVEKATGSAVDGDPRQVPGAPQRFAVARAGE